MNPRWPCGGILAVLVLSGCGGARMATISGSDATAPADADSSTTADAEGLLGEESAPDGPAMGAAFGPDPTPRSCDAGDYAATTQCLPPAPVCADSRYSVNYIGQMCVSGTCTWTKADLDCTRYDGGTCIGGSWDGGLMFSDGGTVGNVYGCLLPVPAPPVISCDEDSGADAAACAPPRSVCLGNAAILYYDDGACIGGKCQWGLRSYDCPSGCADGACVYPVTTPPPPSN